MSVPPRSNALALASSAFQITTPRMQAVMTSAKKITITPGVIRRRKPPGPDERYRSGIFRLDGGVPRHSERQTNVSTGIYRPIGGDAVNKSIGKTTEKPRLRLPLGFVRACFRRSARQFRDRLAELVDLIRLAQNRKIAAHVDRGIAIAGRQQDRQLGPHGLEPAGPAEAVHFGRHH